MLLLPAFAVSAKTPPTKKLYQIIQQQQRQLSTQQKQIEKLQKQIPQAQRQRANRKLSRRTHVSVKNGLRVKSADGRTSFRVGGRLHMDAATYRDDKRKLGNGTEIRRARINVAGRFEDRWRYRAEYDFAGNRVSLKDAWLGLSLAQHYSLKAGQFQAPFSLQQMTSSNHITFMERALPDVFAPGYKTGFGFTHSGKDWSSSGSVFSGSGSRPKSGVDAGWGVAGRVTYAPVTTNDRLLHVGASVDYQRPNSDNSVRLRTTPETHVSDTRLLDTDDIFNVKNFRNYGLEAAARLHAFSLQGEYIMSTINRNGAPGLDFNGWYIAGSWFLTGEHRAYSVRKGIFRGVHPRHHYGAWELAARYSSLDLADSDIAGGREHNWTLGLNVYPIANVRLMVNYVIANANNSTAEVKPNEFRGQSDRPRFFQIRVQVNF